METIDRRTLLRGAAALAGAGVLARGARLTGLVRSHPAVPEVDLSGARLAVASPAPAIITRAEWGADESLRTGTPEFAALRGFIVHHTATQNDDPDPAARVRSIYRYHTQVNGWNDIGYNFLIDAQGRVYEGRYARAYGPGQIHDGEDGRGNGVVGAHALEHNVGTVGIALLGDFTSTAPSAAAVESLVTLLAWKASAHAIDPVPNTLGHRDVNQTSCPGDQLEARLPDVRARAALRIASGLIGYRVLAADGSVGHFGGASNAGDPPALGIRPNAVALAAPLDSQGYWVADANGGVFAFGGAPFYGSLGGVRLNAPIVGMAAHPRGQGYWLLGADGGVFTYGAVAFWGSTGGLRLNAPVVGMAPTPSGNGYWLLGADGGVFTYGDARFYGSTGGLRLNAPVVGMAPTPSGNGYWLLGADGGVFTYGDARFYGSMPGLGVRWAQPARRLVPSPTGNGYLILANDGGVFSFGDAPFYGSRAGYGFRAVDLAPVVRTG